MKIGEVLDTVYDDEVGWRPASGSIKPVHVANGLVRAITGEYYDISSIVEFLVPFGAKKVPDETRSYQRLVQDSPRQTFKAYENGATEFEKARRYSLGLLAADKAVFPSAEFSALTLTCREMVSRSAYDRHLGEFGASVLRSGDGDLARVLAEAVRVERPDDPLTTVMWPLLPRDAKVAGKRDSVDKALKRKHHHACLRRFQDAARILAAHEAQQGNRLRTLEHIVHFVCISTYAHANALAADGDLEKRTPLLVAVSGEKRSGLAVTSERSIGRMQTQFEEWLIKKEAERLQSKKPIGGGETIDELPTDGRSARRVLRTVELAGKGGGTPEGEVLDERAADFEEAKRRYGKDDPAQLMAYALVRSYMREYESGGPRSFLQNLACKTGLLYPHFEGNARQKRVRPSVAILDLLVRTCVPTRTLIPLEDFLEQLWRTFGLVVGGRRGDDGDAELLKRNALELDPSLLVENTSAFVELLAGMGLARRFADNVTFVGDGYAG
jgi:hypothetical protein